MTRWLDPQPVKIPDSFGVLNLHPLVAQTLLRRGITAVEEARVFLHPDSVPSTPFPGIEKADDMISLAIRKGERVCIWGDFDVDGQTSTALLVQSLRALGADLIHYIPIRGREGHGLHIESLKPIIDHGTRLIVTCDTGITAHQAIDYANSRGVEVVVTDHHDPGETLPNAKTIINPKLLPHSHRLASLAGVGVAYKLAESLLERGHRTTDGSLRAEDLLDLVALGLIADVALLKGETRSLTQRGIQVLRETSRLGLKVMAELAGASLETLTEETIGFTLAPRLNALGRLGDANPAVELLLTRDPVRARVLAAQIEGLNAQRRLLTGQVYEAAEAKLRERPDLLTEPAIVLSHPDWPGGVVGIVANRLVERYHKPALLLTESEDGILRGSARSIEGLQITEAIASQRDLLLGFGGHPMAAGLSMAADRLPEFRKGLGQAVKMQLGKAALEAPALEIDAWLELNELSQDLAESLEALAPFGAGNPELTLATRNVTLKSIKEIGKTREHRRIVIADEGGNERDLLWWNGGGGEFPEAGTKFDIAYSLRAGTYRGQKQITLQFEEYRIAETRVVEILKPGLEIRDWRTESRKLESIRDRVLIWAEGSDQSKGVSRYNLHQSDEFAIYTAPPSPAELRRALEIVRPKTIHVFVLSPAEEEPEGFLNRLTGLCKYALNQRSGRATLQELTAAMAARESAVQIGLEWLAAGGQFSLRFDDDRIYFSPDKQEKNPYVQAELFVALRGILKESSAYRKFLASMEKVNALFT